MIEVWQSLPDVYKYPDPDQILNIWRADKVGKAVMGMTSKYSGDPYAAVLWAAQRGADAVSTLICNHIVSNVNSPLISASNDLRLAQYFASQPDETLYGISLPAYRVIRDPCRLSGSRWIDTGEELTEELFVIGNILSSDISTVKINNTEPGASERLISHNGKPRIAQFFSEFEGQPIPRTPNPAGVWERLSHAA